MDAEGWDDPLAAHQEADGDWYVGDTTHLFPVRIPTPHKQAPWWSPFILSMFIIGIITIAAVILLATPVGGVLLSVPQRIIDGTCRCDYRPAPIPTPTPAKHADTLGEAKP